MLITQQLATVANKNLAKSAYRYLGKEASYADLRTRVSRLSYLYQHELGLFPKVAFLTNNSPATILTFFALTNIRATCIPLDPALSPDDIVAALKESRATHVAVTSDLTSRVREILNSGRLSLPVVEIEKKQGGEYDVSFTTSPEHQPADTDPILLLRTSGATEKPRFCSFTHKQINHAAACLRGLYHINVTDRYYTQMNWAHPFAWVHGVLFPVLNGATVIIDHGLQGAELLRFLTESRANRLLGTPPWFYKLLITCSTENYPLVGVKSVTVAGGRLSANVQTVFERMKITVAHCYGQTEALWTLSMQDTAPAAPGSEEEFPEMHKPLAGMKYKVIDSAGDEIPGPESRTGLLAVTTPTLMSKYDGASKELEKKTKTVIRGTWLYTGDVARLEGEGEALRIFPMGRIQDLLQVENQFIAMNEITDVLKKIPGIDDAAAFVTQTAKGQRIIACAIVKAQAATLNEKAVLDFCTPKLYEEQRPKLVVFVEFIPKDLGGNPNYSKLHLQFSGVAS